MRNKSQKSGNKELKDLIKIGAEGIGCPLGDKEVTLFLKYLNELKEWNKRINLTAIKDDEDVITRHFLDSLTLVPMLRNSRTLLDIGSGAGFPGIPLKIILPGLNITLLDSNSKKVAFMRHIIRTLELKGVHALHGSAEDTQILNGLGTFDAVTSRAFSGLRKFLKIAKPYVKDKGIILVVKGPKGIKELKGLEEMEGLNLIEKRDVKLSFSDIITSIFVFKKETEVLC